MRAIVCLVLGLGLRCGVAPAQTQPPAPPTPVEEYQRREVEINRRQAAETRRHVDSLLGKERPQRGARKGSARRQAADTAVLMPSAAPVWAPVGVTPNAAAEPASKPKRHRAQWVRVAVDSTAPLWIQRRQARKLGLPEPTEPAARVAEAPPPVVTPAVADTPQPKAARGIDPTAPLWIQRRQARRLGLPEPEARVAPAPTPAPARTPRAPRSPKQQVALPRDTTSPRYRIGIGLQAWRYQGDLQAPLGSTGFYPGVSLSICGGGTKRLFGTLQGSYGQYAGDDSRQDPDGLGAPNTFARSTVLQLEALLRVRILRFAAVRPHLGVGLSYLSFAPEDARGNGLRDQPTTRALGETYGSGTLAVPLTAGALWVLNRRLALGLDYTLLLPTSDYLDNIGQLGRRSGNDRLHRLQFSLQLGLR